MTSDRIATEDYVDGEIAAIPPGGGAVDSVNGQTGVVVLDAGDVGADTSAARDTAIGTHAGASDPHGDRSFATSAVGTHEADTTSVHGIADTSTLIEVDDPAGGGLNGFYPNPGVVDDSHTHTASTLPAVPAIDATGAATDITTRNVSTTAHGLAPKLPNDATKFLDGTGAYSVPTAGNNAADYLYLIANYR